MLKKGLSIFLATTLLILCFFSVPAFAAEPEFDISDYTFEDLENMTTAEKKEMIEKFIETYNPYGLRDLMEQEDSASGGLGVQPLWKSGDENTTATHELITMEAVETYMRSFKLLNANVGQAVSIALHLAAASALPDQLAEEKEYGFAGHFYSPTTGYGTNVFYKSAKDNVEEHYANAYQKLHANPNMDLNSDEFYAVLRQLGMALHYIQDVCEPHHAANLIAGVSTHLIFESYVDGIIEDLLPTDVSINNSRYLEAKAKTAGELAHSAALSGASQTYRILRSSPTTEWDDVAKKCLRYGVENSALLMYKLFADCGLV